MHSKPIMYIILVHILHTNVKGEDYLSLVEQFAKHQVVPDVIPLAPKTFLKVIFADGQQANLGNVLTPTAVKEQPTLSWDHKPGALYTVIKTDPDAPSREEPLNREFKHWLVVNVRGNDLGVGETLAAYIGAGAPRYTGLHRYIFLVYEQPGSKRITVAGHGHVSNRSRDCRKRFKTADFTKKFDLGEPVAGNFYQAEYDDYVPILHKQLG